MGTRHLILVYYKRQYLIAQYGQWDGDPYGVGVKLLDWLSNPNNLTKLRTAFDNNMIYTPTQAELTEWDEQCYDQYKYLPDSVQQIVPSLSRDTSHKILGIVANAETPVPIQTNIDFINDSLMCEWAYVVDLDENVYEVHRSIYGRSPCWNERFDGFPNAPEMIQCFDLGALPSEEDFLGGP